ncbi:MAG: hypothetical protein NVSMB52_13340 [Chloroflexota bacterium]
MSQSPRDRGPRSIVRPRAVDDPEPTVKEDVDTVMGLVTEALPNAMYAVELQSGKKILVRISGSIQTRTMRVNPGDRVTVELSPYDLTRGRIIRKHR